MKDIRDIPAGIPASGPPDAVPDPNAVLYFILQNHLFGHDCVYENGSLMVTDEAYQDLCARAGTFLAHTGDTLEEKLLFLAETLRGPLPITARRLEAFFDECAVLPRIRYRLLDWAVQALHTEVPHMSSDEAGSLIRRMDRETSLESVKAFCAFLEWMRVKYRDTGYSVTVIPPARRSRSTASQAYSLTVVAALYYYLFCEEAVLQENLVQRACDSEASAHAWLYLSIHLVSALRDTDLARLMHPVLPDPPAQVLQKIKSGAYEDTVYAAAVHSIMKRLGYIHMTPNKTRHHQAVPELVLIIPQSLEPHFGRLFMACEAHLKLSGRPGDGPLFNKVTAYSRITSSLGENIGSLFKERDASPIALARSYMQCLEAAGAGSSAEKGLTAVHGYMLASMARSHKGGPAGFAETTAVYLKDFGLGLISPEQTAREMFDRGILSCLPSMLLDLITDGAFKSLDFSQQADMLRNLALSPLEVESIMDLMLQARQRCCAAIKDALSVCSQDEKKDTVAKALARIAGYHAPGKQPDILCFMSALGRTCTDPAATNCLLCPFRIDTRAAVYHAAGELHRLHRLAKQSVTAGERKKYTLLARRCLLPVIQLASDIVQQTYGAEVSGFLLQLLHEVVDHGMDHPPRRADMAASSHRKENGHGHTVP